MKKLNKLQINPEKVMKNDELLTLRGGYGTPTTCYRSYPEGGPCYVYPPTCYMAEIYCQALCPGYNGLLCIT
jgi:hypothetical protein